MKRSVNLKGNRWGAASQEAKNLLATLRRLGLTDEEIKVELLRWQAERDAAGQQGQSGEGMVQP